MKYSFFFILFFLTSFLLQAQDYNIALEIVNIPERYNEKIGYAYVASETSRPSIRRRIVNNILSGELLYDGTTNIQLSQVDRNKRYTIILLVNYAENETDSVTKFSRRILIESPTITLDYNTDFFDTAREAITHYSPAKIALPREKLWALALTGFLTTANHDQHDMLGFNDLNERNRENYLNLLRRDWGVNNREELLATISDLEQSGHSQSLTDIKRIIGEIMEKKGNFSIFYLYNNYRFNLRQYNYLKFVTTNWNYFENKTIMGWDLARVIALCRWGYNVGFLSEQEAWTRIFINAKRIQSHYASWEDFGFDYYMGRLFWASGSGNDLDYLLPTDSIYKNLTGEQGYWRNFEWNIDLSDY